MGFALWRFPRRRTTRVHPLVFPRGSTVSTQNHSVRKFSSFENITFKSCRLPTVFVSRENHTIVNTVILKLVHWPMKNWTRTKNQFKVKHKQFKIQRPWNFSAGDVTTQRLEMVRKRKMKIGFDASAHHLQRPRQCFWLCSPSS